MIRRRLAAISVVPMLAVGGLATPSAGAEAPPDAAKSRAGAQLEWTELDPATTPGTWFGGMLEHHAGLGGLVAYGGHATLQTSDTWLWDGTTWSLAQAASGPGGREFSAMAYDPIREQLVLFGGYDGTSGHADTWVLDGETWQERTPAVEPPGRWYHSMAFDENLGKVVMFGGHVNGIGGYTAELWAWDGATWEQLDPETSPPGRAGARLHFDQASGELVLFGGIAPRDRHTDARTRELRDTWTFDGTTWTKQSPDRRPTGGRETVLAQLDDRVVLVTGDGGVLRWKRGEWRRIATTDGPGERAGQMVAWDPTDEQIVLFGGLVDGEPTDDTWALTRQR